jgi:hypothetical protein
MEFVAKPMARFVVSNRCINYFHIGGARDFDGAIASFSSSFHTGRSSCARLCSGYTKDHYIYPSQDDVTVQRQTA